MIYKGKGKRTRLDGVVVRHGYTVGVLWWWIYIKEKETVEEFNQITWRDAKHLFFIREINFEFIFIMKFIERPIENAKLFLMIYLNIIIS